LDYEKDMGMTAAQMADINIGYWSGYGTTTDMEIVQRLFLTQHSIFGKAS
jgi:hypothetical protein